MISYHSYFHPNNIIKLLCKYRVKYAMKRHKLHLLADISRSKKTIGDFTHLCNVPIELSKLLPSRRNWQRPKFSDRERFSDSSKLLEFSLFRTILTVHIKAKDHTFTPPIWYLELVAFIKTIQSRINSPNFEKIRNPEIKPIKRENLKSCKECRPLSLYYLEDRIIISLTAKYFTELFDPTFLDCSYAFRAVLNVGESKHIRTHHDTIQRISEYLVKSNGNNIYVAECDIRKFFDCVNHEVVTTFLEYFAKKASIEIDENAKQIFLQYLNSYSFSKDVYPLNGSRYFEMFKMNGCVFKWHPEDLIRHFYCSEEYSENLKNISIGIPQGGALSCFISNLVLHAVDEKVMKDAGPDLLYLRFCDDMIILHTNRIDCEKALDRYFHAITDLKLLLHLPEDIPEYSKKFWNAKSKKPYRWDSKTINKSNVPWLAFVGYQIKYDGTIRIRKKSFEKEKKKQKEECKIVLKAVDHFFNDAKINETSRKSLRQQLFALENRLISMSVGRVKLYDRTRNQTLCWTSGFKALTSNKTSLNQMKILDRHRTKQLYATKKNLKNLVKPSLDPDNIKKNIYFGSPYSYHNFLKNKIK